MKVVVASLVGIVLVLTASSCGGEDREIDSGKLEDGINDQLGLSVSCPEGQAAEAGNEFQCIGTQVDTPIGPPAGGGASSVQTVRVQVEVLNEDGDVKFSALKPEP